MTEVPWIDWYQSLAKPLWTPAPRTIGLIWQILYPVGRRGYSRRLGHDRLDDAGHLAALSLGGRGPGALFRLGLDRHGAAALDHVDESGVAMVTGLGEDSHAESGSAHLAGALHAPARAGGIS